MRKGRYSALVAACLATVLLVPLEIYIPGAILWALALLFSLRDPDRAFRLRMSVLLGAILLLAFAPINTDTSTPHFIELGLYFLAVVILPAAILKRYDPGVLDFRFWPQQFRWLDLFYVAISIPLAWGVIELYFFKINPELPTHWPLPQPYDQEAVWRLFAGINCVGIWDELFFVNTVYALLLSLFPRKIANLAQAVVYASVLNDMAFTGVGPLIIYLFALTQGSMYSESKCLLYVLIVHIIVDAFLVAAIIQYHYPEHTAILF